MEKPKVSIIIPLRKPNPEVFSQLKDMLKKQTVKAEVIEVWNMPEAKADNTGIRKAKGEIIVLLSADCIPENEFWLEKLILPLKDEKVIATVSDLVLPEYFWKRNKFLVRLVTINERSTQHPAMDMRACAYRKKDLMDVGLISEDPKVIGIEVDLNIKLKEKGKVVRANVNVLHLHKQKSFRKVIKKLYTYSEGNGKVIRRHSRDIRQFEEKVGGFWLRILRAIPFFGIISIIYRFPLRKYFYLFPAYMVLIVPSVHIANIFGFWKGFLFDSISKRNTESLNQI
ncbi:MAG: glycosyltransferase family 2 protein [Candidatus Pacearchaeota archaeon]|nr:glycosyltransferase family 2 protein [Candidatus Pacearchaeota archaeon]